MVRKETGISDVCVLSSGELNLIAQDNYFFFPEVVVRDQSGRDVAGGVSPMIRKTTPVKSCYLRYLSAFALLRSSLIICQTRAEPLDSPAGKARWQHVQSSRQPEEATAAFTHMTGSFTCQTRATHAIELQAKANKCHFRRLCLDSASKAWRLYLGKEARPLYYDIKGQPKYEWPSEFLNIGHARIVPYVTWSPTIIRDTIPSSYVWSNTSVAAYVSWNAYGENFAHALFDNLIPMANLLETFHMGGSNFQTILGPTQFPDGIPSEDYTVINTVLNASEPTIALIHLISRHAAYSTTQILQQYPHAPGVCFRDVLAGTDGLDAVDQPMPFWHFRQAVMTNLGINPVSSFRPTILVVHKEGRRRIENDLEVLEALRTRFSAEADVKYYDARNFPQEPITTRASATAIKPDVLEDDGQSLPLDLPDYQHIDHVNVLRLAVSQKDYARTTDRPHCELEGPPPRLRHCNVWLADLVPLFHMVEQALHTWHLDHQV
ncbi:hypothetical protein WJX74_010684 [Apatococcus lobatus]|uniref:Uncharacterized protein n=1 Tax=Apatococcus lobatus TaxID=904363 RepID=A0AAW1SHU0_9CHLO